MAILKQKLNRKNESGTYDEIHLKTDASNVSMSTTDETLLSAKISSMDTAIAGKQPAGSYAAANHNHNGVYQPVGNYQPAGSYATANHSHNGANLSFDSTRSINDVINNNYSMIVAANNEISSLKSSVSNGKSLIAAAVSDKGVPTAASDSFTTMSNNIRNIETKQYSGSAPLTGTLAIGATVTFDSKSWIVMHNDRNVWYLGLATTDGSITFGQSDTYSGSNLYSKCKSWLSSNLSNNAQKYCIEVTVGDVSCKVFPATYDQMKGGWSNTISNNPYGRFVKSGNGGYYWLAGLYGYYASYVLGNGDTGTLSVYESCGFRPFIAIQV